MKTFIIIGAILFIWLILAQSCMKFRISDSEAKQKFSANNVELVTEIIEVDGFSMHYAKTGNDTFPTLFFVHGSPGSWDAFSVYLRDKNLLSKYRMVSVDRPGFGYSEFGNAKNLDEQSKLISPLLKILDNKKPIYAVGHSLGGPMAVKLDADNPGIFSGMVLLAASVDPAAENPEKWRPVLYKTPLKYFIPGAFRPSNEELWYLKKDLKNLTGDFSKVLCPVWIIHGGKDKFVPVSNVSYAKKMLVNAKSIEIKILKDASHFIPWEPWYKDVKEVLMRL